MKWKDIAGHLLFWIIIMLTYAASEWGYRNNFLEAIIFELLFLPVRLIAVYINWFILIPRLLYKNRIFRYLLFLSLLLFSLAILQRYFTLFWAYPLFFPDWIAQSPLPLKVFIFFRVIQNVVIIASPVAFSTGIKIFLDWYDQKNKTKQLEIEKRAAELKYLKSQINPHFLFNTLNNLYGLSIEKSEKVPNLLLKLSEFLNYSLYESTADKISLSKEINLIKGFVALECDRYEDRVVVHWDVQENLEDWTLAPLLFIPLVENAFKHGIREEINQASIRLKLKEEEDYLVFEVENSVANHQHLPTKSGIGLANLKRRLELLYPEKHVLKTTKTAEHFIAILKLKKHG